MTRERPSWVYSLTDQGLLSVPELRDKVGGKAASLIRLHAAGKRIPAGFVITPAACRAYWSLGQSWPGGLAVQVEQELSQLESFTGRRYGQGELPLTLAVRSGAAHSMPGTMATVLNVGASEPTGRSGCGCGLESTELAAAINAVFDSWNSPAAQTYRRAHRIDEDLGTAAIVQVMHETQIAGVVFSRDPSCRTSPQMVVEAVRGCGDELLRGTTSASRWLICRDDGQIALDAQTDEILAAEQLAALYEEILELESVFEDALDVEWGLDDAGWLFFQVRPIRFHSRADSGLQLGQQAQTCEVRQHDHRWREPLRPHGEPLVRHNLAETLQRPTPLSWSIWQQFASRSGGLGKLFKLMGFSPAGKLSESVLELVGGEIYVSPRRVLDLYCRDFPFRYTEAELRKDPSLVNRLPRHLDLAQVSPWFLLRLPQILFVTLRALRRLDKLSRRAEPICPQLLQRYETYLREEAERDLQRASVEQCRSIVLQRTAQIMDDFYPEFLLPGTIGVASFNNAEHELVEVLGQVEGTALAGHLWAAIRQPIIDCQQAALTRLAARPEYLGDFIDQYGHRGFHELELATPRWRDDRGNLLRYARDLGRMRRNSAETAGRAWESLEATVKQRFAAAGASSLVSGALLRYRSAWSLVPCREEARHQLLRGYELIRSAIESLAEQTGLGPDVYYLTLTELQNADWHLASDRIAERKRARREMTSTNLPAVLTWGQSWPANRRAARRALRGMTICPGRGQGRVVFANRVDLDKLGEAYVLVCQFITPAMLPALAGAAAVVVEQASLLSHGAVLAREFGVPVVSLPEATTSLVADLLVVVDADEGTVVCLPE